MNVEFRCSKRTFHSILVNVSERQSCDLIRIRNFAEKNISYKEQTNICWEHVLKMFVSHHSEIILNIFNKINVGSH